MKLSNPSKKPPGLLANKSANWAEWDDELLKLELDELKDMDFDLELTGVDADELLAFEPVVVLQADEDDVPEVQENVPPVTKSGDLWVCGNHRLLCGSSLMIDDMEKLMGGTKADMWLTGPPSAPLQWVTQCAPGYHQRATPMTGNLGIKFTACIFAPYMA